MPARLRRASVYWSIDAETGVGRVQVGIHLAYLNPPAAAVWADVEEAPDRATMVRRMHRRYPDVEESRLREDLDRLLDRWLADGWLEWQEDPVFPFAAEPWPA